MATKPILNQEDIRLLKSVFASKEDLVAMEARMNKKFASKADLEKTNASLKALVTKKDLEKAVEEIYLFFTKYFKNIQLEEKLSDHEDRIKSLELKPAFL